jgi:hypothetical protein
VSSSRSLTTRFAANAAEANTHARPSLARGRSANRLRALHGRTHPQRAPTRNAPRLSTRTSASGSRGPAVERERASVDAAMCAVSSSGVCERAAHGSWMRCSGSAARRIRTRTAARHRQRHPDCAARSSTSTGPVITSTVPVPLGDSGR